MPLSATGLFAAGALAQRLQQAESAPAEIGAAAEALRQPDKTLAGLLASALADELPAFKRDGGFVREGFDTTLDETRALRDESRRVVAALQARYADDTQVRALKIRHNNVLGYFVEVTAQHGDKLMAAPLKRDLYPSPDAGRTGAIHNHGARRTRTMHRQRCRPLRWGWNSMFSKIY